MKKKHYIKDISDIKYCEEKGLTIYSYTWEPDFFKFDNGVWCMYSDNELKSYNSSFDVSYDDLYYYEEEPEEQEATEKDVGKLCKFYDTEADEPRYSVLEKVFKEDSDFPFMDSCCDTWEHCRRLSPAEVAEITGYGVTEDGSTFYGEPFKIFGKEK